MRVCFVSSMHPPTDKRVFHKEAVTLARAGHTVTHLAPGDGREWMQGGVQIVTHPPAKGLWRRLWNLGALYRRARQIDAQVYHCNEVDSWLVGAALRVLTGRAFIFDVHEHYPEGFAESYCPLWLRPLARAVGAILIRSLARMTSAIVLAKASLLGLFSHLPPERVVLVENFAERSALRQDGRPDSGQRPLRIIHSGFFSRTRGWPQLLKAMSLARCQTVELLVLGAINDGSERDFHADVTGLGLTGRVHYQAWLPYEEAMARLKEADVGVVLFQPGVFNHVHALPHKMFDYMASELATIAPEFAVDVAAIVHDARCGLLVDAKDPRSIAGAIDRLCDSPALVRTMGRNGRNAVVAHYNWEAEARKLLALYARLEARISAPLRPSPSGTLSTAPVAHAPAPASPRPASCVAPD